MDFRLAAIAGLGLGLLAAAPAHAALTIGWGATTNVRCSGGVCISTDSDAVLGIKDLERRLAQGNLTVVADPLAYDIAVEGSFSWAGASNLELFAAHSIRIDKTIDVAGSGGLTLTSNDGLTDGRLSFGPKGNLHFWGNSNALTIDNEPYLLANSLPTLIGVLAAHPSSNVALTADYDAAADGIYASVPIPTSFRGTLEGLGHTVAHLQVKPPNGHPTPVGLVNSLQAGAAIADLHLTAAQFQGRFDSVVGGLAVQNNGTLVGDTVQGTFTTGSTAQMGGIAGYNYGTIRDCHSIVQMSLTDGTLGGIAAENFDDGVITDSSSRGTLSPLVGAGYDFFGGLVGSNGAAIQRSWSSVAVTVGSTTGTLRSVGGGLAAVNASQEGPSTIADSYATGSVTGNARSWVGGLVGAADYTGGISNSYSTGVVTTGTSGAVGGFIGNATTTVTMSDDYWDLDTSGVSDPSQGAGNHPNRPGIMGLTNAQLRSGLPAGFGGTIWARTPGVHGNLPYLISNPPY
jgi:hypothetical protein